MIYRDVVKYGFHDLTGLKDTYMMNCENKPRYDLIERYIFLQLLFLYPICPHFCEIAYIDYFLSYVENPQKHPHLLGECHFPKVNNPNHSKVKAHQYIIKFMAEMR